jgi:quercetin dioxygenase-like cupin family protein
VVAPGAGRSLPGTDGEVLAAGYQTAGRFSLARGSSPPGDHVPAHVHREHDKAFYVLAGEYFVTCGRGRFRAPAGSFVYLPRGVPHSCTAGPDGGQLLVLGTPGDDEESCADIAARSGGRLQIR